VSRGSAYQYVVLRCVPRVDREEFVNVGVVLYCQDADFLQAASDVDRSWRNPNLLVWGGELWAIDHGASLYFHHGWTHAVGSPERFARQPYDASNHVLVGYRHRLPAVDAELAPQVTRGLVEEVLALVPDVWLTGPLDPDELRATYVEFLLARVAGDRAWLPTEAAA